MRPFPQDNVIEETETEGQTATSHGRATAPKDPSTTPLASAILSPAANSDSDQLDDLLESVFGTTIQRTSKLIKVYGTLYTLPCFSKEWTVDPLSFIHATKTVNFVLIALYGRNKQFLIVHSTTELGPDELVGWRLLGGPIHDHRLESIDEAVNRIVQKEVGVDVAELQPIAIVKNGFKSNGRTIEHTGLAFIARAADEMKVPKYKDYQYTVDAPEQMVFLNREVFLLAVEKLREKYFEPPLEEVHSAQRSLLLEVFHRYIFKTITYRGSRRLKKRIKTFIGNPKSVLDAAAGDDELILEIARDVGPDISVANDISWRQMAPLRRNAKARVINIIFTNHNVAELPFTKRFDIVLFKNTLHHTRNKEELLAILGRLKSIAKRLVFVDVEDPKREFWARMFNLYYTHIYGDGDEVHHFFTRDIFQQLIRFAFPSPHNTIFDRIHTIKGTYMIAVVDIEDTGNA